MEFPKDQTNSAIQSIQVSNTVKHNSSRTQLKDNVPLSLGIVKGLANFENSKLRDAIRLLNPTVKRFTWRRRNPIKQARLDYFLISQTLADLITNCNIKPGYRSDHSRVDIDIILNTFNQG